MRDTKSWEAHQARGSDGGSDPRPWCSGRSYSVSPLRMRRLLQASVSGDAHGMDPLDLVFRNLDAWRHLPAYQLERRADIFFSVYLKGVIEEVVGVALEDTMLPELPIKRDLIWPERPTDASVKVDYALFTRDRSRVFFVELKTDGGSRRDDQDKYLSESEKLGFRKIVAGIRSILLKTNAHQKYHHLAATLAELGYLTLPPELDAYLYDEPRVGLSAQLRQIQVTPLDSKVEVIYLQPEPREQVAGRAPERCVDFAQFAAHVRRFEDPVSRRFAESLERWRTPAGGRVAHVAAR